MFCYKCGQQIPDDAQFCMKCGTAQNVSNTAITTNTQSESKDLDREAIKIYLSNVLALECIIQKLSTDFDIADKEIEEFQSKNLNEKFQCSANRYAWLRYDGNRFYLWFDKDYKGNYHLNMWDNDIYLPLYEGAWFPIDENIEFLNNPDNYPFYADSIVGDLIIGSIRREALKNGFWKAYNQFKSIAPQKYQENLKRIMPSMEKRSGIENEIKEAKLLLQKAYDINIIPKQFRNIYAIWFIHDYIATSTESLSAAFLQCNLDEIKQKLDTIIEQQREIIINQQVLIAQNAQMIELNQQTLNRLANIEQNTDRAAQYAEIASNNVEACAWIGLANYVSK